MNGLDLSLLKQQMTDLLKEDKLQEFIDNMTQINLFHNQLKIIAPIQCNTCGILKHRCEYQRNGLKKCKDCLGLNKRKRKQKQREKVQVTINDIHKQFLRFHNITDIKDVINIKIDGIDYFCNHLHKYYVKQKEKEYYKYYYFFSDMIQELQYKNDKKEIPGLDKYLKQYEKSILN